MQENNVFVLPVVTPAVPPNTSRLRMNVSSDMTKEDLNYVIELIVKADDKYKIL